MQAKRDEARGGRSRRGDPTYVHAKDAGVQSKGGGLPCAPGSDDEDDENDEN